MNIRAGKSPVRPEAAPADVAPVVASENLTSCAAEDIVGSGSPHFELPDGLRELGRSLLDAARTVADEAARQARLRPVATLGVAALVGIMLARALRR